MSPDLDAILSTRYPGIFAERHDPSSPLANGITCGDGWFTLIDCLCHRIEVDANEQQREPPIARQVKEKLGGLRIYWRNATEIDQALTQLAADLSFHMCEVCAAPGELVRSQRNGLLVLCSAHREGAPSNQTDRDGRTS
jgi:hypothetical protein